MGRLAETLAYTSRDEVKVDPGGGAIVDVEQFHGAPGEDSAPLEDDYVVLVPLDFQGREVVVGFYDPNVEQVSLPGERRLYSRDAEGVVQAQVRLRNDGALECTNASGSMVMAADGAVNINGVVIDASGNITAPGTLDVTGDATAANVTASSTVSAATVEGTSSVQAAGLELAGHQHAILSGSSAGTTGPNQ